VAVTAINRPGELPRDYTDTHPQPIPMKKMCTYTEGGDPLSHRELAPGSVYRLLTALILLLNFSAPAFSAENDPRVPIKARKSVPMSRKITAIPTITAFIPSRNLLNASANTSVRLTFSEAMNAATASNSAIRVYGSRTGKRSGTFSGAGTNVAGFQAAQVYKPGETVSVVTTTAAQNAGGTALAKAEVYHFTVAAAMAPANFIANPGLNTGSTPHGIYPADLDGDGDLDVAIANAGANHLTVRLNNGNATFAASVNVALPGSAEAVFAADLDGDGDMDLASANTGVGSISVRMNNGSGSFSGGADYPAAATAGSRPADITGADFDGDGDIDLATSLKTQGSMAIFTNDGAGNFSRSIAVGGSSPHAICTADFDGDGDMDLAVTNTTSSLITIKMNDGSGSFSGGTTVSIASNSQSVQAVDFNGDGHVDLAAANIGSNSVSVRFNDGLGNFSGSTEVGVGNRPYGLYAGDIDGDGDMDLVTANQQSNTVSIRLNSGNGSFSGTTDVSSGGTQAWALQLADFDGDSDLDMGVVNGGSNQYIILLNKLPAGTNTPPTITSPANQTGCVNAGSSAVAFTVGDAETAPASLIVTATSSNPTLVPPTNMELGGSGASRTVTLTPAANQTGTTTITLTVSDAEGMTASSTFTFTVNAALVVTAGSDEAICTNASALTLTGFSPAGGTWSGNGVSAAGVFTPASSLVGAQTLTYTVTQNGCTASATKAVTVNLGTTVTAGTDESVCSDAAAFSLSGFSPAGGTWSGNGVSAAGVFTPTAALVGTQTLTYTLTQNGCTASATKTITVKALPVVMAGTNGSVCADASALTLTGFSPAGGTWSGNGVSTTGVFTPSASLVGVQTLTYTVTQNGCTASATTTVTVNEPITLTGITSDNTNCLNPNGSIQLNVSGGTTPYTFNWTNGMAGQSPTGLSAGGYTVIVSDATGCSAIGSFTISDPNAPVAFSVTGGGNYCQGGSGLGIGLSNSMMGINYQLLLNGTPDGSPVAGTGTALDFGLKTAAGAYTVTARNAGGCSAPMTGSVSIATYPNPSLVITDPPATCGPVNLTTVTVSDVATTPVDGILSYWTDVAATQAVTNPESVAISGTYFIKKTTADGCSDIKPVVVTISSSISVQAGPNQTICASEAPVQMSGFSPAGGTWSGNGVNASGLFTPTASLVGAQTLTYTVTQNGCTGGSATKTVTVTPVPTAPTAGANSPTVGESLLLTASPIANASYQWTGPLGFTSTEQNPTIPQVTLARAGTYSVQVTANGCSSPVATVNAVVNPAAVPTTVTLTLDAVTGNPGTSVVLRIQVKDFRNILSAQGSIGWNSAVVSFQGIENFGLPGMTSSNFGTTQAGSGTLAFSWFDASLTPRTLPDDAILFSIRFNLLGNVGTASDVILNSAPVAVEVVGQGNEIRPVTIHNGQIRVAAVTSLAGIVKSPTGSPVRGVGFQLANNNATHTFTTAADGLFQLTVPGQNFTLTPFKQNDVVSNNGVSTLDLILIQRHILGISALNSPYKLIAADVNQSGTVSTLDIVLIRSLILQNTTTFPGNQLWTFVRSDLTFANPANPFPFEKSRTYGSAGSFTGQDFIGVKLGDVNDSWDAGMARIATEGQVAFRFEDQRVLPGQEVRLPVKVRDFRDVSGYQFTINWNPEVLEYVGVEHQALTGNYGLGKVSEGKITTTWQESRGQAATIPNDSTVFILRFRAAGAWGSQSAIRFNSSLTTSEAYNRRLGYLSVVSSEATIRVGEPEVTRHSYELSTGEPNPFHESTLIRFSLPSAEEVSLHIFNSFGQLVKSYRGRYPAGAHQIRWSGTTESGQPLSTGTYFVRMQAGPFVKSTKLVRLE